MHQIFWNFFRKLLGWLTKYPESFKPFGLSLQKKVFTVPYLSIVYGFRIWLSTAPNCLTITIRNPSKVGGTFLQPFFGEVLFCTFFAPPKVQKRDIHRFQKKNDENFGFCLFCLFAYFCFYFQIFFVFTPGANATQGLWVKFGLF